MSGKFSVYVHIPYCRKKCPYCHFYVTTRESPQLFQALQKEWEMRKPEGYSLTSLYFGGGTPYLLEVDDLKTILEWIDPPPGIEITLEANPEDLTLKKTKGFAEAGVNRLSLGAQSFDQEILTNIGRSHTPQQAINAVQIAREAGIANISLDVMIDLPHQTIHQVENTCQQITELPITHISLYNLVIEAPSLFHRKKSLIRQAMPKEAESMEMLACAVNTFDQAGFDRYEISAFAKPGFHSHHNFGYWTARPFLGLGPTAFSYWEGKRFQNASHQYIKKMLRGDDPTNYEEKLAPSPSQRELLAIRLRINDWLDLHDYPLIDQTTVDQLVSTGLLQRKKEFIRLSEQGLLFYDTVASELI